MVDPCGTPDSNGRQSENDPFNTVLCFLSLSHPDTQSSILPSILCDIIVSSNLSFGTLSKALLKSRYIMSGHRVSLIYCPCYCFLKFQEIGRAGFSVLKTMRNDFIRLFKVRCLNIQSLIRDSMILQGTDVNDTGL